MCKLDDYMKRRIKFPEFFTKERPTITLKETLKDVIPVEWIDNNSAEDKKGKIKIHYNKKTIQTL